MKQILEVIDLVANKYLDKINILLNKDMLTLEYLYTINCEEDVYQTMQITEFDDKLSVKFYPEKINKIISVNELEDIFEILEKQIHIKKYQNEELDFIKNKYKAGTKIKLIKMYNLCAKKPENIGVVKNINDIGQIQIMWNDNSCSFLNVDIDKFEIIERG